MIQYKYEIHFVENKELWTFLFFLLAKASLGGDD
jgi:hypothetical protein